VDTEILARGLVAILLGYCVGLEHEFRRAPGEPIAGPRTFAMVALGAALTTSTELENSAGAVITGIGFLGGGLLLAGRGAHIASSVWAIAAIGGVVGRGALLTGALITGMLLLVLESDFVPGRRAMERWFRSRLRYHGQDWDGLPHKKD
jgi:putative Mg2+ transporter-C (MgtC) family protein